MSRCQQAFPELVQNRLAQTQQPQSVGHGGPGFSHPGRRLFLGHAVFPDQRIVAHGFFHRVQVGALEIFDEGQLHGLFVVRLYYHHRHLCQLCQAGCPPTALAGDDLVVAVGHFPYSQGLNDAMGPDGLGQFFQLFRVKVPPGLIRIGLNFVQR